MTTDIYRSILTRVQEGRKSFAVLIDPDEVGDADILRLCTLGAESGVDFFFLGGSLVTGDKLSSCIQLLKENSQIPIVLFPGSINQVDPGADALLLLSLISGRNPELLIGQHVLAAPMIKRSGLEVIPTGYILVDGGVPTTVSYISNTLPIPFDKPDIAASTALAGEMLGLKVIYLDAGSGAKRAVPQGIISAVRSQVRIPIITGGGIRSSQEAVNACRGGADIIVVGNALEKDPDLMGEIAFSVHSYQHIREEI